MNVSSSKPRVAVTIGDPAGIGPEVVLKALSSPDLQDLAHWIVVGDRVVLEKTAAVRCGMMADVRTMHDVALIKATDQFQFGVLNANCGSAALEYVRVATEMCLSGKADAMVTAPLNKEAVTISGISFSGHTEYIAELCGAPDSRMMLSNEKMSIVHVTTHIPLRSAIGATTARILRTIELGNEAMKLLGCERPRIAISGINPHAGEHGMFGLEEVEGINPSIEAALSKGWQVG